MGSDHEFRLFNGLIACARCGVVQRADGFNKPCPGEPPVIKTRTTLGDVTTTSEGRGRFRPPVIKTRTTLGDVTTTSEGRGRFR